MISGLIGPASIFTACQTSMTQPPKLCRASAVYHCTQECRSMRKDYVLLRGFWNVFEVQPGSAKPVLSLKLQIHWRSSAVFLEQIWEGLMFHSPLEDVSPWSIWRQTWGLWANWFVLMSHWGVTLENTPHLWQLILEPDVDDYCGKCQAYRNTWFTAKKIGKYSIWVFNTGCCESGTLWDLNFEMICVLWESVSW